MADDLSIRIRSKQDYDIAIDVAIVTSDLRKRGFDFDREQLYRWDLEATPLPVQVLVVRYGLSKDIKRLHQAGYIFDNKPDKNGLNVGILAAQRETGKFIFALSATGYDFNKAPSAPNGLTVGEAAVKGAKVEVLKALKEVGYNFPADIRISAAQHGSESILALHKVGYDFVNLTASDHRDVGKAAIESGANTVRTLAQVGFKFDNELGIYAIRTDNPEVIKAYHEGGGRFDSDAGAVNQIALIETADKVYHNQGDVNTESRERMEAIFKAFHNAGGKFDNTLSEERKTAAMHVVWNGIPEIIEAFANNGGKFDLKVVGRLGRNVGHFAAMTGDANTIKAYSKAGGTFNDLPDETGKTAADWANEKGPKFAEAFRKAVASAEAGLSEPKRPEISPPSKSRTREP